MLQTGMFTHRLAIAADMPMLEGMMDAAIRTLAGSARSMGVTVEGL